MNTHSGKGLKSFTFEQNQRSHSVRITVHVRPEWVFTLLQNMQSEKDGFIGAQKQGYLLLLKCVLMPVLMVFGFEASIVLSDVLFQLLNKIFLGYLHTGIHGMQGIVTMLFGSLIYAVITISLVKKCFELVHIVPDQIMRWVGGSSEATLGSGGQHASSAFQTATIAASNQMSGVAGSLNSVISQAGKKGKEDGKDQDGASDGGGVKQAPKPKPE